MEKILQVKNLSVTFNTFQGKVNAVRDINFHLNRGETLAIVGESGCGKTVTSKTILKLLKPPFVSIDNKSQILYEDENILKFNKKKLNEYRGSEVSMIFQDPMTALNPTMKIGNQIAETLLIHNKMTKKEAREEAINKLKLVNIPNPEKRYESYPHQLSGGMRQRVGIAIALACNPKILIADEPTTALDVTIQAQILELLKEIQQKLGMAIILVTHDLGVVANFADRIQVMYAGEIIEEGTVKEIFYESKHPYTWALLNSIPKLEDKRKRELFSLKGSPPDLILDLKCCPFHTRCQCCMHICKERKPENTFITNTHSLSCWLQHESAPKVNSIYEAGVTV